MSTEQRNPYFLAWGMILRGWSQAALDEGEDANAEIAQGLAAYRSTGAKAWLPCFLGLQAESDLRAHRPDEALAALAEALALTDQTQERCWQAELNRIKGELLLASPAVDQGEAERCLSHSLAIAREQQAKSWQLRAAVSLGRLWWDQGKHEAARDLLSPIHDWFSEGLETPDLRDAAALLDELDKDAQGSVSTGHSKR